MKFLRLVAFVVGLGLGTGATPSVAGVWQDDFVGDRLFAEWRGDTSNFRLEAGELVGVSFHPLMTFLRAIEVGRNWSDYTARCRVNVVMPNLAICSKGGIVLRSREGQGIVFAVHPPSEEAQVFDYASRKVFLSVPLNIEWKHWYRLRADAERDVVAFYVDDRRVGETRGAPLSGSVGLTVEDTMEARFDDFRVEGPGIPDGGSGTADLSARGKIALRWARLKRLP